MVTPFLGPGRAGPSPSYLHDELRPALEETCGVVVFHEQVIRIVAVITGCALAEADEVRRALGSPDGQAEVREWFYPPALAAGYALEVVERIWAVLKAFASFGFCKAHAAAFALPTYQSAWLKAHHPAAFLAGVLTYDPGMYPKRLILDDARQLGIAVLGLDVNASDDVYRVERVGPYDEPPPAILGEPAPREAPTPGLPDGRAYGIRLVAGRGQGHQRGRGRPHRRRPALRHARRLLAPRPGVPSGGRAARRRGGLRQPLRPRLAGPRPAPRPGHPPGPAPPGRRAGPLEPGRRPAAPAGPSPAPARSAGREQSRQTDGAEPAVRGSWPAAVPGRGGRARLRTCSWPSTSATPRRTAAPGCRR